MTEIRNAYDMVAVKPERKEPCTNYKAYIVHNS